VEDVGVEVGGEDALMLLFLKSFCSVEDSCGFGEVDDGDDEEDEGLDRDVDEDADAYFLIEDLEGEGSNEHGQPIEDVHGGDDDFILVVVLEVLQVHQLKFNKIY